MVFKHINGLLITDTFIDNTIEFFEIIIWLHRPFGIRKLLPIGNFIDFKIRLIFYIPIMGISSCFINMDNGSCCIRYGFGNHIIYVSIKLRCKIIFFINYTVGNHNCLSSGTASGNIVIIQQIMNLGKIARQNHFHRNTQVHPIWNSFYQAIFIGITLLKIILHNFFIFLTAPRSLPIIIISQIFHCFGMCGLGNFFILFRTDFFRFINLPQNQQLIFLCQSACRNFFQIFNKICGVIITCQPWI